MVRTTKFDRRGCGRVSFVPLLSLVATLALASPAFAAQSLAEWVSSAEPEAPTSTAVVLVVGTSQVVEHGAPLERVSIGAPTIADAVVVSANEVVVIGKIPGQTTLLLWDNAGGRAQYQIFVTADAPAVQMQIDRLLPNAGITATASGGTIILSGEVDDPGAEGRIFSLATSMAGDAPVLNQMTVPDRGQIMIKVRFAEVNRSAMDEFGLEAYAVNGDTIAAGVGAGQFFSPGDAGSGLVETAQEAVNFFLFHKPSDVTLFLRALQSNGVLRSLAEPTLMAVSGAQASFLAGGEFPFPVLQGTTGGTGVGGITVEFKEFGIRLNFIPTITNSGAIRIDTSPEVSQLDFSQGLAIGGFQIPALLTRRAQTTIELDSGQTFAIAGLVDNSMSKLVSKIPLLGDIPVLGALFRSEEMRQNRSELLVLVTPHIIRPQDGPAPAVPTGEPETWQGQEKVMEPVSETEGTSNEETEGTSTSGEETGEGAPEGDDDANGTPRQVTMPARYEPPGRENSSR